MKATLYFLGLVFSLGAAAAHADADNFSWCFGFSSGAGGQHLQFEKSTFGRAQTDTALIQKLSEFDSATTRTVKSDLIKGLADSQRCEGIPRGSEGASDCRRKQRNCVRKIAALGIDAVE